MSAERIVEIASDGRHLAVDRGFMTVSERGTEIARIPLDDIASVIGNAHGLTWSNNLLVQLAKRNAALVICGPNHNPVAFLWAVEGFHQQASRMDAQLAATGPKGKQIWKQVVQAKIAQQAGVLEAVGSPDAPLNALVPKVRSGDPDNIEAQAARRYWQLLFGSSFRRDRDAAGVNSLLNYGYMILRSSVARATLGAGLHPGIPLHHKNANNPMRLADDLMEPFRPVVDFAVFHLLRNGMDTVTPETKRILAGLPETEIAVETGMTALRTGIQNAATSLALVYEGSRDKLDLPLPRPPLWQAAPFLGPQDATIQRAQADVDDGNVRPACGHHGGEEESDGFP
ncbi:MAG TPA: type II CRISPR-associated endonuclease Cas1 [Alphaproteobacteria bacterium]|nr:type II CRISPR-associated endonuclease Cas1 [Alphaproteobacteria bacterium]